MNFFDKYFFGYLPEKLRNIIRGLCLIVLLFLIFELAITFIFVMILIAIVSRILQKIFF
jgi:hypothetical protein